MSVTIGAARPTDLQYVTTTWLQTYERSEVSEYLRHEPRLKLWGYALEPARAAAGKAASTYYGLQRQLIGLILARPYTRVLVAMVDGDPDTLAGWVCFETVPRQPVLLHYVTIKPLAKGNGFARQLLAHAGIGKATPLIYTHHTHDMFASKIPAAWRYDRAAAFTGRTRG